MQMGKDLDLEDLLEDLYLQVYPVPALLFCLPFGEVCYQHYHGHWVIEDHKTHAAMLHMAIHICNGHFESREAHICQ